MPTMPQQPGVELIDPSLSVPTASGARPAATAAAEPDEDPEGVRSRTYGLRVWPPTPLQPLVGRVERTLPHSDRLVLPSTTAPARRRRRTSNASAGIDRASAREPAVVGRPETATLSLIRTGSPSSAPTVPRARRRSLAAAWSRASGATARTEPISPSTAAIRARQLAA